MRRPLALAALPLTLVLSACGETPAPGSTAIEGEEASLVVENAWVRTPPPGRDMTAGYFTVSANYNTELVSATSAEARVIELHTMAMDNNVMRMREVEGYDIRADEPLRLESGGNHLMIFGLTDGTLEDGELAVTLEFADGETVETVLVVGVQAPG